jgi:hypothetical protein
VAGVDAQHSFAVHEALHDGIIEDHVAGEYALLVVEFVAAIVYVYI